MMREDYNPEEVAKICKVSRSTVINWLNTGKIDYYRIPTGRRDRRITRASLIEFMKKNSIPLENIEAAESHKTLKILGISVDYIVYHVLKTQLEDGYELEFTNDLFSAGMLQATWKPDVVIMDFSLGESETKRLSETIRKLKTPPITVIAIVGPDRNKDIFKNDFTHILESPINSDLMIHLLLECFIKKNGE